MRAIDFVILRTQVHKNVSSLHIPHQTAYYLLVLSLYNQIHSFIQQQQRLCVVHSPSSVSNLKLHIQIITYTNQIPRPVLVTQSQLLGYYGHCTNRNQNLYWPTL